MTGKVQFLEGPKQGFFQKVWFFNYFRHDKSEPHFTDDCIFTEFLNFLPNRFRLEMEPHELIWKSVTANLHRIFVSIFKIVFKIWDIWNLISRFLIFQTQISVFLGPVTRGHVQEFTNLSWNLKMLDKLSPIPDKSWSYIPCRQYGSSLFSKIA